MRRAIGRGLSQLIAEELGGSATEAAIDLIDANPMQPRLVFDAEALEELAASIKEHGIIQPLIVRPNGDRYELIAGERRLRAASLAGLDSVPIVIRTADAQESLELALIENVQREDIGPVERAHAYKRLVDEFGLTQDGVAERVGKARASVANTLRLLRLPRKIQDGISDGLITEGHAKALLAIDSPEQQSDLYERIVQEGLNVREVERLSREPRHAPAPQREAKAQPEPLADPNTRALEEALSAYLGSPVHIQRSGVGGRLTVDFYSEEDLARLVEVLGFSM